MSWTDERIERLKELWSKGMTASQIADELGAVSRNAVIGKAHRLGLTGKQGSVSAAPKRRRPPSRRRPASSRHGVRSRDALTH